MGMPTDAEYRIQFLFHGVETVINPLVCLMRHESEYGPLYEESMRAGNLEVLEALSVRLWHMATSASADTLRMRLLLEADSGEKDLDALEAYAELLGLAPRSEDDSDQLSVFDLCEEADELPF